jgi:endonuclease/exonuclease/phosphatase family metal-dependent hydrolase
MVAWTKRWEKSSLVDPVPNLFCHTAKRSTDKSCPESRLKLLSFNIQTGIKTKAYRHYLTNGWKHVLPHENRFENMRRIAQVVEGYDLVALQEVDSGSIRSRFVNQVKFLAESAHFPYWYAQLNRNLGPIAQHGNGLLSRLSMSTLEDHKLPGALPGRGAMIVRVPYAGDELTVVMLHLSLGPRSRDRQLSYVAEQIAQERQVVVMGDMNTHARQLMEESPLKVLDLSACETSTPTYPAWQPSQSLDHILVSPNLKISAHEVLADHYSDHLPVAVEVTVRNRPPLPLEPLAVQ